jgi:hypothetical protein
VIEILITGPRQLLGSDHVVLEHFASVQQLIIDSIGANNTNASVVLAADSWLSQAGGWKQGWFIRTSGLDSEHNFELAMMNLPEILVDPMSRVLLEICAYLKDAPIRTLLAGQTLGLEGHGRVMFVDSALRDEDDEPMFLFVVPLA